MKNIYTIKFMAVCPVNEARISYTLTMKTPAYLVLPVEQIEEEIEATIGDPIMHEKLADDLFKCWPVYQSLVAAHSRVQIETIRC